MKEKRLDASKRMLDAVGYVGDDLIESAGKRRKTLKSIRLYALLAAGVLLLLIAVPSAIRSGNVEPIGTEKDPHTSDWYETPFLSEIVPDPPITTPLPPFYETTIPFETPWIPMTTEESPESALPLEETTDARETSDEIPEIFTSDEITTFDFGYYT